MNVNFWIRLNARAAANPLQAAIIFMLVSTLGFSLMNVCVRLAAETMDATFIVTLRNFVTLIILVPLVMPNNFKIIRTKRIKAHFWRSAIGAIGMITWTYCLTLMPLAHATALSFTAPLLSTLFAILILKEHATYRHAIALALGVIGVLIILRPSIAGFEWNSLLVILATTAWAITALFIKSLTATEPPLRMIFYMNLFMFFLALPFGFLHWQTPTPHEWLLICGIAFFSICMHFTMVKAYALVPVVTLMPFDFMRLVYTSILAYFVFHETSDLYTWLGAAIIVASVVIVSKKKTPSELAEPV